MNNFNSLYTENISQAKKSIGNLQQNLINFLEKGEIIPINIKDFVLCYGHINAISGKIKGEDEAAANIFAEFVEDYICKYVIETQEKDGEEYLDFLIKKWNNFKIYLSIMDNIFYKIKKFMKQTSLICMAFNLLKKHVFDQISEKLNKIIISFIEIEREDQAVPQNKILASISVMPLF